MATTGNAQSLAPETVAQLRYIFKRLFDDGQHWVRNIGVADWRRTRYVSSRARRSASTGPSVANLVDDIGLVEGYLTKNASTETGAVQSYVIVKPDSACLKDAGIALLRPVLKTNFSNEPQLNFHVWFHCVHASNTDDHLMVGWRLEAPEGGNSHDFFHAQPLRDYDGAGYGLHPRFPVRFPSIPLPASDVVELCLTAVLMACGKEALRGFVTDRRNTQVCAAATAFWAKVFGGGGTKTTT